MCFVRTSEELVGEGLLHAVHCLCVAVGGSLHVSLQLRAALQVPTQSPQAPTHRELVKEISMDSEIGYSLSQTTAVVC
jgi:hypothetical protein